MTMNFTNDTLVWFFLAAVVVGVFIGGKVVLMIMQIMGRTMCPPMHNSTHINTHRRMTPTGRICILPHLREKAVCLTFWLVLLGWLLQRQYSTTRRSKIYLRKKKNNPLRVSPSNLNKTVPPAQLNSVRMPRHHPCPTPRNSLIPVSTPCKSVYLMMRAMLFVNSNHCAQ